VPIELSLITITVITVTAITITGITISVITISVITISVITIITVISPAITPTPTISLFLMEQVMPIKVSYLADVTNVR